jgi:hypothetical protein
MLARIEKGGNAARRQRNRLPQSKTPGHCRPGVAFRNLDRLEQDRIRLSQPDPWILLYSFELAADSRLALI